MMRSMFAAVFLAVSMMACAAETPEPEPGNPVAVAVEDQGAEPAQAKPPPVPFCPAGEVKKCTLFPVVCSCVPETKGPIVVPVPTVARQ